MPSAVNRSGRSLLRRVDGFRESVYICELMLLCILCVFFYLPMFKYNTVTAATTTTTRSTTRMLRDRTDQEDADEQVVEEEEQDDAAPTTATAEEESNTKSSKKKKKKKKKKSSRKTMTDEEEEEEEISSTKKKKSARHRHNPRHHLHHLSPLKAPLSPIESVASPQSPMGNSVATAETAMSTPPRPEEEEEDYETRLATNPPPVEPISSTTKSRKTKNKKLADVVAAVNSSSSRRKSQPSEATLSSSTSSARQPLLGHSPSSVSFDSSSCSSNDEEEEEDGIVMKKLSHQKQRRHKKKKKKQSQRYEDQQTLSTNDWFDQFMHEHGLQQHNDHSVSSSTIMSSTVPQEVVMKPSQKRLQEAFIAAYFQQSSPSMRFQEGPPAPAASSVATTTTTDGGTSSRLRRQRKKKKTKKTKKSKGKKGLQDEEEQAEEEFMGNRIRLATETSYTTDNATPVRAAQENDEENILVQKLVHRTQHDDDDDDADGDDEGGLIMHDDTPSDIPTVIITTPQDHDDDEVQEDEDELALRHDDKKKKRRKKKKKKKHSKTTDTSTTNDSSSKKKQQQQQEQEQQVEDDGEDEEDNSHPEITMRKHIQTTLRPRRQATSVEDFENDMSDIIVPSSASTTNTTNSINNNSINNNGDDGVEDPRLVLSKNETFETATSSFLQEHKRENPVGDGSDLSSSRSKGGRDVAAVEVMLAGTDTHTTATAASTSDDENHKTVTLQPDTTLLIFNYLSALADEQHKKRALDDDEKSSAKTWSSSDPASVLPSSFGSDRPEDDDDDDDDDSTIAPFKITNSNSSDPTHMVLDQVLLFDKSTKKTGDSQEDKNDYAMDTTNKNKAEPSVSTIEAATVPQAIGEQQATIEVPATTTTKVFPSLSSSTTARTSSPADQAVLAMILNDQADITDPAVNPVLELLRDDGDLTLSQLDDRNDVIARLLDEELQTPTSSRDGTDGPPKAEVAAVKEHIANIPGVQTFQPSKQGRGRAFVDSIRLFFLGGSTAQQESSVFDVTPPATAAKDNSVLQSPFSTTTVSDATVSKLGGARDLSLLELEGEAEEATVMNTAKSNGSDSGVLISAESAVAEPQRVEHISPRGGYLPCCVVHSDGGFELEITSRFNRLFEVEPEQQLEELSAADVVGEETEATALPPPTLEPKAPPVEETKEETEDLNEIVDRIVDIQASTEDDDDDACTLYSVSSCYFEDIEAYATTQSSVALEVVKKDERNVVFLVRGKADDVSLSSDRQLVKMMESNASWLSPDDDSADEANSILAVDVNEKKESGQEERETPATPSSLLQGYDTLIRKLLFGSPEPKEEFTAKDHGEIQNALKKDAMQLVEMAEPNSTPDINPCPDQKDEPKLAAAPVLSKQEDDAAEDQPARDTPSAPAISGRASVQTTVSEAAQSQISQSERPQLGGTGSRTTDGSDCKQESFKGSFDGVFLAPLGNIEGFLSSKEDDASSKEAFWIAVPQAEKYVRDQVGEPSDPAQNLSNINDILASSDDDSSAGISKSSGGEIACPWTSSAFTTELLSNNEVGAAAEVEVHVALDDTPCKAAQQDSKDRELVPNAEAEPETQLPGNNSHEDETSETAKSSSEEPETVLNEEAPETAESNHEALETALNEEASETQSAQSMEACSTLTDSNDDEIDTFPSDDDSEYSDEHSVGAIIAMSASVEVAIGEEEDSAVQFVHDLEAHTMTNDDAEAEVEADQIDDVNSSQTEIQDGVLTSPSEAAASDDGSDAWSDISESEETVEYVEEAEDVAEGEDIFGYTAVAVNPSAGIVVAEASDAEHMNDEGCEGEVRADASSVSTPVNREFEFEASREEQVDDVAIDTVSEVANDNEPCETEREEITDTTEPMLVDTVDSEKKNVFIDEESEREAPESVSSSTGSSQEEEVVTVGNNSEPVFTDETSNSELGEDSDVGNEELASTKSSSEDDMLLCVDATDPNLEGKGELSVADKRDLVEVLQTEQLSTNSQELVEEGASTNAMINSQDEVLETEQTTEEETVPATNSQELVEEGASTSEVNSQDEVLETEQTTEEETAPATNSQELVEEGASTNAINSQEEVLETEQTTEEETNSQELVEEGEHEGDASQADEGEENPTEPAFNKLDFLFASEDEDDDDDAWETDTDGEYVDDFLSESLPDGDLVSDQEMNSTKGDDGWETESEIASPTYAPINAWHVEHFKTEDDQLDVDETQDDEARADDELPHQEASQHILDSTGSTPQNSPCLVVDTTNEDEWETDSEIVTPRPESTGATKMLFALEDEEDEVQVADCDGLSDHGADEAAVMVTEEMPSVQVKTTIPAPDAAEGDEVDEEDNNLDTEPSVPVEAMDISSSDGSQSQDAEGQKETTSLHVQEVVEVAVSDDASCSTIESTKEEEIVTIVDSVHKETDGQEVLAGEVQPEETTPTQEIQTEHVISETINAIADTLIAEDCHPLGDEPDDMNVETEIVFQRSWGSSSQNHQEEQAEEKEKAMHLATLLAAVGSDDTATEKKEDDVSFEEISEIAGEELLDEFYKMETASALQAAVDENRAEARGQTPLAAKSTLSELDDFYKQLMTPESGHEAMRSSKPSSIAFPPRARTLKEHIEHWDLARALAELTMVRQELESMKRILQTKAAALEIAEQELRDQGQVIARVELEKALLVADLCHATATPASFRAAMLGTTSNQQTGSESEV